MEFETNSRTSEADELECVATKQLTVNPLHTSIQPLFDPDKARQHERSGTSTAFTFDTESTAPAALVASVSSKKKVHFHFLRFSAWVSALIVFVFVLVLLKTYY